MAGQGRSTITAAVQLLMLPSPRGASLYPLNGPAWSLMFEFIVNVLYVSTWRYWTLRTIPIALIVAGASLIVISLCGLSLDGGWSWADFAVGLARVIFGFSTGVYIFKLYQKGYSAPKLPKTLLLVLATLPVLLFPEVAGDVFRLPVLLLWMPLVVFGSVAASTPESSIELWLGRLSYPLYAIHYPLYFAVALLWPRIALREDPIACLFVLAGVILLALVIERIWDRPIRKRVGQALM